MMAVVLLMMVVVGLSVVVGSNHLPHDEVDKDPELVTYFQRVSEIMAMARGQPSQETALRVAAYEPTTDSRNPEELGSYFEGDILYPEDKTQQGRNGLMAQSSRWPNGTIPFSISTNLSSRSYGMVMAAIGVYRLNVPCISFVPRTTEEDYIYIFSDKGCYSSVGRIGGEQKVSLQEPGCTRDLGTILHEFMHALGFLHEQSREDRDDYVDIHWENIMEKTELNFGKAQKDSTVTFGVNYTYLSVMHYSRFAFSKNKEPTIVPKPDPDTQLGQRDYFHDNDIKKLRAMYGCPATEEEP